MPNTLRVMYCVDCFTLKQANEYPKPVDGKQGRICKTCLKESDRRRGERLQKQLDRG